MSPLRQGRTLAASIEPNSPLATMAQPAMAQPVSAQNPAVVSAQPMMAQPVMAQPVVAQPVVMGQPAASTPGTMPGHEPVKSG